MSPEEPLGGRRRGGAAAPRRIQRVKSSARALNMRHQSYGAVGDASEEEAELSPLVVAQARALLRAGENYESVAFDPDKAPSTAVQTFRRSWQWRLVLVGASCAWICACFFEEAWARSRCNARAAKVTVEALCVVTFVVDTLLEELAERSSISTPTKPGLRRAWRAALCASIADITLRPLTLFAYSAFLRPFSLYFFLRRVRTGARNTVEMLPLVSAIVFLELYLALVWACACVAFFGDIEDSGFDRLGEGFVNLFALSTTVNNPDVWLPLYARARVNGLVFAAFLVVLLFFVHNFVVAFIFDTFNERLKDSVASLRARRDRALRLCFRVLVPRGLLPQVRALSFLRAVRPKYSPEKLSILYGALDVDQNGSIDESEFLRIIDVLSLRVSAVRGDGAAPAPAAGAPAFWLAAGCANGASVVFAAYVGKDAMAAEYMRWTWALLTALTALECGWVYARSGRGAFLRDFWNLHALLAVALSAAGLFMHFPETVGGRVPFTAGPGALLRPTGASLVVVGRCVAMACSLRWIALYRDVFDTFSAVLPAVAAQCIVLYLIMHLFAFVGMVVWGGAVDEHSDFPLASPGAQYFLLNFNSYAESLATLFQLVIVNNWHVIASGYVALSGKASYLYFIAFNIFAVSVGLNLMTAFFINTLMCRLQNKDRFHVWEKVKNAVVRSSASAATPRRRPSHAVIETGGKYEISNRRSGWDEGIALFRIFELAKVDLASALRAIAALVGDVELRILSVTDGGSVTVEETEGFVRLVRGFGSPDALVTALDDRLADAPEGATAREVLRAGDTAVEVSAALAQEAPRILVCVAKRV